MKRKGDVKKRARHSPKKKPRKTLGKLKQDLQRLFNAFIRQRDDGKPCISCGEFKKLQAGHFFPVSGYDGLRFDEDNVHGECSGCNCFDGSHLVWYQDNLIKKIGKGRFDALKKRAEEYKRNGRFKWDRLEIEEKISHYRSLLK